MLSIELGTTYTQQYYTYSTTQIDYFIPMVTQCNAFVKAYPST